VSVVGSSGACYMHNSLQLGVEQQGDAPGCSEDASSERQAQSPAWRRQLKVGWNAAAPVPSLTAEDEVRDLAHARYFDGTKQCVGQQLWATVMGTTCGSWQEQRSQVAVFKEKS